MAKVFRLARERYAGTRDDLLSGEGARRFGGRWNHKGVPAIYASAHVSLAVLEVLVHSDILPPDFVVVEYELPDPISTRALEPAGLPSSWADHPFTSATQDLGTAWIRDAVAAVMTVPSAVVPSERNWLLNPAHPEIARVRARVVGPFPFDRRLEP